MHSHSQQNMYSLRVIVCSCFAFSDVLPLVENAIPIVFVCSDFVYTFSEEKKLTGFHAGLRSAKQEDVATMNIIIQEEITRVASHLASEPVCVCVYVCACVCACVRVCVYV